MLTRNPLANARGLGSAKQGVARWWMQRLSAVAMVPLTLWFVFAIAAHVGDDYYAFVTWISQAWVAVAFSIYLACMFYHSQIGLGEVCEDYLHQPALKMVVLIVIKFAHALLGAASIFAVLKLAFGGA